MSTDPSASDFDPLLALYSEDAPPARDVKVFDNIAVFEGSLKKQELSKTQAPGTSKRSQKSFSQRKRLEQEVKSRDVGKLKQLMEMRKKMDRGENPEQSEEETEIKRGGSSRKLKEKNLLTSMESLSYGPHSLLHKIVREHSRCNVYVRDFCGLRGVCSGYIVAYDRYTNLAMVDIDETFRKPPLGKVANHQKPLCVSTLEDAMKRISLGSGSSGPIGPRRSQYAHRSTSGVQVKPRKWETSVVLQEKDGAQGPAAKTVGTQYFHHDVFHGGLPSLYHRHLNQLLVRGDSIVLISLKK